MDIRNYSITTILGKSPEEFTLEDIVAFINGNGIRMVNFMYPAADGKLKTLTFPVTDENYLLTILTCGERVDGSSLFSFIEAGNSDLYVLPRIATAFVDPFEEIPTLCFLCAFFDKDGNRLECSPEYTLHKAADAFRKATGMEYEAMGELEYYVSAPEDEDLSMYPASDQKGYHESAPFAKFNQFRAECMFNIMVAGGRMKYGHSEVGNFRMDGRIYEQHEIEFLPVPVEKAADTLMVAKWIIRNTAYRYGLDVSFAPKITTGKAGSGLHVHMRIMKDGKNMMTGPDGHLSDTAKKAIAGMMTLAPSITAFGNANPVSYLRLVPHQEAPTSICWGDRNRSVLVRVPLGWNSAKGMFSKINPGAPAEFGADGASRQTVEIRSADCSADIYLLLAAICTACRHGLEMPDALETAERTYVDIDIHKKENAEKASGLAQLPDSCSASADRLAEQREAYEKYGVFDRLMIDATISRLKAYNDSDIRQRLEKDHGLMSELVKEYYYCG